MNSYVIHKYVNLSALEGLQEKGGNYTFRCAICGDSKKSKRKKRGWILTKNNYDMVTYTCHNCGITISFENFLKQYRPFLYKDFRKETFLDRVKHRKLTDTTVKVKTKGSQALKESLKKSASRSILKLFSDLDAKAIEFCKNRKLPEDFIKELYYSDNYIKVANDNNLKEIKYIPDSDPRIVIPFYNEKGHVSFIQGRSIDKNNDLRYLTIKLIEDEPKIWGLDRCHKNDLIFVTEGVLDAVFIDNGIAMAGGQSDLKVLIDKYGAENLVMVYDADIKTNKHIRNGAKKAIDMGLSLFFWEEVKNPKIKDLNDLILDGCSRNSLNKMLRRNVHKGLSAKVKLKIM